MSRMLQLLSRRTSVLSSCGRKLSNGGYPTQWFRTYSQKQQNITIQDVKKIANSINLADLKESGDYFTLVQDHVKEMTIKESLMASTLTATDLFDYFAAAKRFDLDKSVANTLLVLRAKYPQEIKSRHYTDAKVPFLRLNWNQEMIAIFEEEKMKMQEANNALDTADHEKSYNNSLRSAGEHHPRGRMQAIWPIFYVWATAAHMAMKNYDQVMALLTEMQAQGYGVHNDMYSRLMIASAKEGNHARVEELMEQVDPMVGLWNNTTFNHVITSMGIIGKPYAAFDFYLNSNIELTVNTFNAIMEICNRNKCLKEATDILSNRHLFNLKMNTRAFNAVIEALIMLNRADEVSIILEEMQQCQQAPNLKTMELVQELNIPLDGLENMKSMTKHHDNHSVKQTKSNQQQRQQSSGSKFVDTNFSFVQVSQQLQSLVKDKKYTEAASLADQLVASNSGKKKQLYGSVLQTILRVYFMTKQFDKIDPLISNLANESVQTKYILAHALRRYTSLTTSTNSNKGNKGNKGTTSAVVDITRAKQVYAKIRELNVPCHEINDFTTLVSYLKDPALSFEVFQQLVQAPREEYQLTRKDYQIPLHTCMKHKYYDQALEIFNSMCEHGSTATTNTMMMAPIDSTFAGPYLDQRINDSVHNIALAEVLTTMLEKSINEFQYIPTLNVVNALTPILYHGKQHNMLYKLVKLTIQEKISTSTTSGGKESTSHTTNELTINSNTADYLKQHLSVDSVRKIMEIAADHRSTTVVTTLYTLFANEFKTKNKSIPVSLFAPYLQVLAQKKEYDTVFALLQSMNSSCGQFSFTPYSKLFNIASKDDITFAIKLIDLALEQGFWVQPQHLMAVLLKCLQQPDTAHVEAAYKLLLGLEAKVMDKDSQTLLSTVVVSNNGDEIAIKRDRIELIYSLALNIFEQGNSWKQAMYVRDQMKQLQFQSDAFKPRDRMRSNRHTKAAMNDVEEY